MPRQSVLIFLAMVVACSPRLASSQPDTRTTPSQIELPINVEFKLADPDFSITSDEKLAFLQQSSVGAGTLSDGTYFTVRSSFFLTNGTTDASTLVILGDPAAVNPNATEAIQRLKSSFKPQFDPSLSREQRKAKIKQLDDRETQLTKKTAALNILSGAQSNNSQIVAEKLKQLRAESQRLDFDRSAKNARRQALLEAVNGQRNALDRAKQDDAILKELRELVKLRERDVEVKQQLLQGGQLQATEVASARTQVSETKIRLAERESQVAKAGKGELLDRLTDELAMVSVDVSEIEIRLEQIRDTLTRYDLNHIDDEKLSAVIQSDPDLRADEQTNVDVMRQKLQEQLVQIWRERFNLKVQTIDIEWDGRRTLNTLPIIPERRGARGGRGARGPATSPSPAVP